MVTKRDIKQLLSKRLTGMEVARLIIEDSVEVDHHREGFLSPSDIQRLKNSLSSQADIQEYNKWIRVYQLADYSAKEACIYILEAGQQLHLASVELQRYWLEQEIRALLLYIPAIVTQKQYEELKAKQRERKLKSIQTLWEVFNGRAYQVAPQDIQDEASGELAAFLIDEHPELYKEVVLQILQIIREGKLKPVELDEKARKKIEAIRAKQQAQRDKEKERPGDWPPEGTEPAWHGLYKEEQELLQTSYQEAKARQSQDDLDRLIQRLEYYSQTNDLPEAEAMSPEEQSRLVDYTLCSGEDLSQAGLPEWISWVDKYMPNWEEETAARPAGMMQSARVAIIQDPDPDWLDERGYYKDAGLEMLSLLSGYQSRQKRKLAGGLDIADFIRAMHKEASERIKIFLAIQAVLGAVSQIIGVKLTEDLEKQYASFQPLVKYYNVLLTDRYGDFLGPPHYLGMPKLDGLKIGKLEATAKSIQYYRERMAMALGDDWWKEAIQALELQAEEEGSLADQFVQEIRAHGVDQHG